jgi:enoyl-CoA hydratase
MDQVSIEADGAILVIRLTRAAKYNALSREMYDALAFALARLNDDAELRVGVLHAEGRHFTAGIELDQWAPLFRDGTGFRAPPGGIDPFGLCGPRHAKPLVMAVQGYCFTWGVEMMLNTEIRIAAEDTQFQMLEVQRGLYPCAGATIRLPREIGWGNASQVLLTGDRWSAADAYRWGMVQQVVPVGTQFEAAMEVARRIARAAPLGVQGVMREARHAQSASHDEAVASMVKNLVPVMRSEDSAEGVRSFLERREARFTGR